MALHMKRKKFRDLAATPIGQHQVSYEAVTSLASETFHSAEGMYLPTIEANCNGPLAAFNRHIDGAMVRMTRM